MLHPAANRPRDALRSVDPRGDASRRQRPQGPPVIAAALALAGLLSSPSCAKRTDERVQAAWGGGSQAPGAGPRVGSERPGDNLGETEAEPVLVGWARLDQILDGAVSEAALGTDAEVLARLADRWCDTMPEPQRSDEGPILVCLPDPPVQIGGHGFSLELGGEGVIGLVAAELSEDTSTSLVDEALIQLDRWCTRPWSDVSPRPTEPKAPPSTAAELHTCPVEGSALLVVARFVSNMEAQQWRVSVAVIDAS